METEQQIYQFTQGYSNLHRLQVYHLTITFVIHNKCVSTLYLYTYIHTYIYIMHCSDHLLMIMPFSTINIRYKLLGTYKERSRQEFIIYISFSCVCLCC